MLTPNEKSVKLHRKLTTLTRHVRAASLAEAIGGPDVAVAVRLRFAEADKVYRVARKIYDGPLSDTHDLASDVWDQIHGQWCVIRSDPAGGPGMTIFLDARPDVAYTYSMPTATEVARIVTAQRQASDHPSAAHRSDRGPVRHAGAIREGQGQGLPDAAAEQAGAGAARCGRSGGAVVSRVQAVDLEVVQAVASRMFDPMPPSIGYFAFAGEQYRRVCGRSAEETVIDATLALARVRRDVGRAGMIAGVHDFVKSLRPARRKR